MDKETLSNYGWVVILVLILAVMLALATPFGTFVAEAVQSTTQGLFDTNKQALDIAGIVIGDQSFEKTDNEPEDDFFPEGEEGEVEVPDVEYFKVKTHDTLSTSSDDCITIKYAAGNYYAKNPITGEKHLIMSDMYAYDRGDTSCLFVDKRAEGLPASAILPGQGVVNWEDGSKTFTKYYLSTNVFGTQTPVVKYEYADEDGIVDSQSAEIAIWILEGDTFRLATGNDLVTPSLVVFKDGDKLITNAALGYPQN